MSHLSQTIVLTLFTTALVISGCDKKPATTEGSDSSAKAKIVATVNSEKITEADYQNYLQLRQQQVGPVPDKAKERQVVLDEMIEKMLLAQHAVGVQLDSDPEVGSLIRRVREEILVQAVRRKLLRDNPITEEDVKKRFAQEVENTHKTEYKVRHILVPDEAQAKELLASLGKGTKFDKLAREKSIDSQSGKEGGALGWINQGMVSPEMFQAITVMKKGDVSAHAVKTDFGWHVLKLEDTRPLKIPTFDEFVSDPRARAGIYRKMQDDRMGTLVKELKNKAKITVN